MTAARSLREVFDELVGAGDTGRDPQALVRESGHTDLPPSLVSEALVSYADTAPVEVAEHLAPFVTAHSAVPGTEPGDAGADGLHLLLSAPTDLPVDEPSGQPPADEGPPPVEGESTQPGFGAGDTSAAAPDADPFALDFGGGDRGGDPADGAAGPELPLATEPDLGALPEPEPAEPILPPAGEPAPVDEEPEAPLDGL